MHQLCDDRTKSASLTLASRLHEYAVSLRSQSRHEDAINVLAQSIEQAREFRYRNRDYEECFEVLSRRWELLGRYFSLANQHHPEPEFRNKIVKIYQIPFNLDPPSYSDVSKSPLEREHTIKWLAKRGGMSVATVCTFYQKHPKMHAPKIAKCLWKHSDLFSIAGLDKAARNAQAEPTGITRTLLQRNPKKYGLDLTERLREHGNSLSEAGLDRMACDAHAEWTEIARQLDS